MFDDSSSHAHFDLYEGEWGRTNPKSRWVSSSSSATIKATLGNYNEGANTAVVNIVKWGTATISADRSLDHNRIICFYAYGTGTKIEYFYGGKKNILTTAVPPSTLATSLNAVNIVMADGTNINVDSTTGSSFGGTSSKISFYGVTPIVRQVLATGASATVDDVITALQNLGLVKQS